VKKHELNALLIRRNQLLEPPALPPRQARFALGYCCNQRLTVIYGNQLRCPQCGKSYGQNDPLLTWHQDPPPPPHRLTPQQQAELKKIDAELATLKEELIA
jgi:hypothetical protein